MIRDTRLVRSSSPHVRSVAALCVAGCLVTLAGCGAGSPDERLAEARDAFQAQDYQRTEVQLKTLLNDHGDDAQAWLLLGRTSLARGRFDDAVYQLGRARDLGVPRAEWQVPLGRALIGAGDNSQAASLLSELDSDLSSDERADALAFYGFALAATDQPDAARAAFSQALEITPAMSLALRGRASVAEQRGNIAAARQDLQKAIDAHPADRQVLAALGELEFRQQRCEVAEDLLSRSLDSGEGSLSDSRQRRARGFLANCQIRTGQTDQARENVSTLLTQDSTNPYANYLSALLNIQSQDYQQAANDIQATLNADPNNLRSLTLMAWIRIAQGRPDTARPYLERVLARAPDDVAALRMRAGLMLNNDQQDQALSLIRQAYERNPDNADLRQSLAGIMAWMSREGATEGQSGSSGDAALQIDLAQALARIDTPAAALTVLDQVETDNAEQRGALARARADILLSAGDNEQAVAVARRWAERQNDVAARLFLARTYAAAGQYDQAQSLVDRLAQGQPQNSEIARVRASLAARRGDTGTAIAALAPVYQANPDDPGLARELATLYVRDGQPDQAVSLLRQAIEAHPDDQALAILLARVYLASGTADQAMQLIEQRRRDYPDMVEWSVLKGRAELAAGQTDAGLATLADAAQNADSPVVGMLLARTHVAQDQLDAAADVLARLREQYPEYWPAAGLQAVVQARQGETQAAMNTVAELRNADQAVLANIAAGDVHRIANDYQAAENAYAQAYAQQPSAELALSRFAVRRAGNLGDPAEPLADWFDRSPSDRAVMARLATWYESQGALDQARSVYRRFLEVQPDDVVALNNLALLVAPQDRSQAITYARRAHEQAPNNPSVTDTLGWLLWQAGQQDAARPLIAQAFEAAEPFNPELGFHYGVAFIDVPDQHQAARQALQRALDNGLDADQAERARSLLSNNGGSRPSESS